MLLIPINKKDGSLFLEAYSFSIEELDAVSTVLSACGVDPQYHDLPRDGGGRKGRLYTVQQSDVSRIETHLGVRFEGTERETVTRVEDGGQTFQCKEITLSGDGKGCVDILAVGQAEATVKCGLVANNNKWLGGVAQPGQCQRSHG